MDEWNGVSVIVSIMGFVSTFISAAIAWVALHTWKEQSSMQEKIKLKDLAVNAAVACVITVENLKARTNAENLKLLDQNIQQIYFVKKVFAMSVQESQTASVMAEGFDSIITKLLSIRDVIVASSIFDPVNESEIINLDVHLRDLLKGLAVDIDKNAYMQPREIFSELSQLVKKTVQARQAKRR